MRILQFMLLIGLTLLPPLPLYACFPPALPPIEPPAAPPPPPPSPPSPPSPPAPPVPPTPTPASPTAAPTAGTSAAALYGSQSSTLATTGVLFYAEGMNKMKDGSTAAAGALLNEGNNAIAAAKRMKEAEMAAYAGMGAAGEQLTAKNASLNLDTAGKNYGAFVKEMSDLEKNYSIDKDGFSNAILSGGSSKLQEFLSGNVAEEDFKKAHDAASKLGEKEKFEIVEKSKGKNLRDYLLKKLVAGSSISEGSENDAATAASGNEESNLSSSQVSKSKEGVNKKSSPTFAKEEPVFQFNEVEINDFTGNISQHKESESLGAENTLFEVVHLKYESLVKRLKPRRAELK